MWCGLLKREREGVENEIGVETIVHGLEMMDSTSVRRLRTFKKNY